MTFRPVPKRVDEEKWSSERLFWYLDSENLADDPQTSEAHTIHLGLFEVKERLRNMKYLYLAFWQFSVIEL